MKKSLKGILFIIAFLLFNLGYLLYNFPKDEYAMNRGVSIMYFVGLFFSFYKILFFIINKISVSKNKSLEAKSFNIENKEKKETPPNENKRLQVALENSSKINFEDIMAYNLKKIDPKYLKPKLVDESKVNIFTKKIVVITGEFDNFSIRNEIAKLLWSHGADVNVTVSKTTDYLIAGKNPGPKKMDLAESLGVVIVSELEFIELLK